MHVERRNALEKYWVRAPNGPFFKIETTGVWKVHRNSLPNVPGSSPEQTILKIASAEMWKKCTEIH